MTRSLKAFVASVLLVGTAAISVPVEAKDRSIWFDNSKGKTDRTVTIDRGQAGQRNITIKAGSGAEIKFKDGDKLTERAGGRGPGGPGQRIKNPWN